MKFLPIKNRKIIFGALAMCAIVFLFLLFTNFTYAQAQPEPPKLKGGALSWLFGEMIVGIGVGTVIFIINQVLWLLQTVLAFILSIDAYLLNEAFKSNVTTSPAAWSVVRQGWSISRDMVNSLLILIVLWIAFTIIFGREEYGGKKLLARVVVMALIVNFSLVMVGAVFGFSNAFANIFAKQIPEDVSGFIVNAIKAQTVLGGGGTNAQGQKVSFQQLAYEEKIKMAFNPQEERWGVKDTLLASVGITPVTAAGEEKTPGGEGTTSGNDSVGIKASALDTLTKDQPNWLASNVNDMVKLIAGNLFLLLTIAAVLVGAVALWMRILFMIFLSIVAPLALLAKVTPIGKVQKYFDQWTGMLFNWAFFAPGFYFLFYLSLYMLQTFDRLSVGSPSQEFAYLDFNKIIQLILALGLMVMSVKFAKKTGGALTDAAMGAASKVGGLALGAATGGAGLAVGAAARAAAPQIKGAVEAVSRVPVLNKVLAPATRRVSGYVEEQQKVVEKRREGLKGQSDDMLVQHMRTSILAQDKVAAALELISRGSQARIKESGIDFKDLAEWGGRYGKGTADTIKNASYDLTPKKKYDGVANEMVAKDALDRNAKAFDRIAAVLELLKRPGQLNKATEQGLDMREIIRLATGFGNKPVEAILQSRPDLASPALGPEFTLEKIATKIKPDEINVQYDSMIRDMTTQGRSPAEIDNTLQRILQAVIVNGGSTERLGKMFSGLQGQSKDARNKVLTQVQLTLDNKPFWDSLESPTTGDPESFKRHVKYFVGRGVPAGLKTPTHLKDSAKRLGIKGGTP